MARPISLSLSIYIYITKVLYFFFFKLIVYKLKIALPVASRQARQVVDGDICVRRPGQVSGSDS